VPSVAVPDGELFSPLGTPAYTTRSFYSRESILSPPAPPSFPGTLPSRGALRHPTPALCASIPLTLFLGTKEGCSAACGVPTCCLSCVGFAGFNHLAFTIFPLLEDGAYGHSRLRKTERFDSVRSGAFVFLICTLKQKL
jgi:hypothetical protein